MDKNIAAKNRMLNLFIIIPLVLIKKICGSFLQKKILDIKKHLTYRL